MFDYLQKFNTLPQNLRDSVSSPAAMAVISKLEEKYKIDLASTVMKVMVKTISLADLAVYFVSDFSLDQEAAKKLTADLKEQLFFPVANYLGYNASYSSIIPKVSQAVVTPKVADKLNSSEIDKIIKDSKIIFPGVDLNSRFRNILNTYLKGVRSRIDTRLTLNKEIALGGLGLDYPAIDQLFSLCDDLHRQEVSPSTAAIVPPSAPVEASAADAGLQKVRQLYEKSEVRDIPYDLKSAILNGEIKKPEAPLNLPIADNASEKLLEAPDELNKLASASISPSVSTPISTPVSVSVSDSASGSIPTPTVPAPAPISIPTPTPISAPIVTSIPISASPAAAIKVETPLAAPIAPLPKIERPPEKKPNLISKIFNKEEAGEAPVKVEIKKPVEPIVQAVKPSVASRRAAAAQSPRFENKPEASIVADVRQIPRVMGPIEELHYLDVVNFRRFGASPVEAAAKVEAKIKLLEKDGYDKMISGVLAWRESLVNSLYLKMGQEALVKGISFKQCADNYQNSNRGNFLIWEEIEAIIALNSRLMF